MKREYDDVNVRKRKWLQFVFDLLICTSNIK